MHITVFGATSTTGRPLLARALAAGHHVTALTRDPAGLADVTGVTDHPDLVVLTGDVTDPTQAATALDGADAVVVTLGAGRAGAVREAGTRAVVAAMRGAGVRRLVVQSTLGTGSSRANLDLVWKHLMFGLLLRAAYRDHVRQEEVTTSSGLDWTLVRPSAFTDVEQPDVRRGFGPDERGLRLKVGRTQVADLLLEAATSDAHLRRAVSLSA